MFAFEARGASHDNEEGPALFHPPAIFRATAANSAATLS